MWPGRDAGAGAGTGRIRLPRAAFDLLMKRVRGGGERGDLGHLDDLDIRMDGGGELPALRAAAAALREPVCTMILRLQDADGRRQVHEGWIDGRTAVILLADAGDQGDEAALCELAAVHPDFLPEAVARITRLGPRRGPAAVVPLRLRLPEIEELTSPDPADRAAAVERLAAAGLSENACNGARSLATGLVGRWELMLRWTPAPGSAGRRGIHVIDSDAGLWLLEPAGSDLLAWPVTATAIWRLLIRSLPGDDELGSGAAGPRRR